MGIFRSDILLTQYFSVALYCLFPLSLHTRMVQLLSFSLFLVFLVYSAYAADQLTFGTVHNISFSTDGEDTIYFTVEVPYSALIPAAQRVAILTYVPLTPLNVFASFTNQFPNSTTNNTYTGSDKDGSQLRGIVWVDNLPAEDATLYISVTKAADMEYNFFGLNIEWPDNMILYQNNLRYQVDVELATWQTKWFVVNYPKDEEQYFSAVRGEFCDEPQGEVTMSLIFANATTVDQTEVVNPCGCDDLIVENTDANLITSFTDSSQQMFIFPNVVDEEPIYAGLFYYGSFELGAAHAQRTACPEREQRRSSRALAQAPPLRADASFSMRLSLWGQELFPTVRTRYTKPDRVNDDLLANVDDTANCDYYASDNFTAYVSGYQFRAFDAACFLEKYTDNFTVFNFDTLVGNETLNRVLVLRDYFDLQKENNDTYFNIVHSNEECGSFAYFHTEVPTDGWELEKPKPKKEWTAAAIGVTVLFGFLASIFLLSTVLLLTRLREYSRYRKI